jgi:hypothetical protein
MVGSGIYTLEKGANFRAQVTADGSTGWRRSRSGSIRRYTNANTFSSGHEAMRPTAPGMALHCPLHVQPIPPKGGSHCLWYHLGRADEWQGPSEGPISRARQQGASKKKLKKNKHQKEIRRKATDRLFLFFVLFVFRCPV